MILEIHHHLIGDSLGAVHIRRSIFRGGRGSSFFWRNTFLYGKTIQMLWQGGGGREIPIFLRRRIWTAPCDRVIFKISVKKPTNFAKIFKNFTKNSKVTLNFTKFRQKCKNFATKLKKTMVKFTKTDKIFKVLTKKLKNFDKLCQNSIIFSSFPQKFHSMPTKFYQWTKISPHNSHSSHVNRSLLASKTSKR